MAERLNVKVEPATIDGVHVDIITTSNIATKHQNRQAVHVHGGCYVLNSRGSVPPEAMFISGFNRLKVIAVDYRIPPDAYSPPRSMTR